MGWLNSAERHVVVNGLQPKQPESRIAIVVAASGASTVEGTLATYSFSKTCPHFTLDPASKRVIQHIDTDLAAPLTRRPTPFQAAHLFGTVIWVNIVKRATAKMGEAETRWVGKQVSKIAEFVGCEQSVVNSGQAMANAEWNSFFGICWASCVPGFVNAGPGPIDVAFFLNAAASVVVKPKKQPEASAGVLVDPEPVVESSAKKVSILGYFKGEPIYPGASGRLVDRLRLALGLDLGDYDDLLFGSLSQITEETGTPFDGSIDKAIWKAVDKYLTSK